MAYLGRVDLQKYLAEHSPNHPFAHSQISLVPSAPARPKLPMGRHGVTVGVSWGYERHECVIGHTRWRKIRQGQAVMVRSIGWYEGKSFPCYWYFDLDSECSLVVDYGDDGGQGFQGNILDAHIDEHIPRKKE